MLGDDDDEEEEEGGVCVITAQKWRWQKDRASKPTNSRFPSNLLDLDEARLTSDNFLTSAHLLASFFQRLSFNRRRHEITLLLLNCCFSASRLGISSTRPFRLIETIFCTCGIRNGAFSFCRGSIWSISHDLNDLPRITIHAKSSHFGYSTRSFSLTVSGCC